MAFPSGGAKPQPLVHKMVEIYVGDPTDLPPWWYVADGRGVTLPDSNFTILPDLTGFLCVSNSSTSNAEIMNTLPSGVGKPTNWTTNTVSGESGSHNHNANGMSCKVNITNTSSTHTHNANWTIRGQFFRNEGEWVDQNAGNGNESYINRNAFNSINTKPTKVSVTWTSGGGASATDDGEHTHNINSGSHTITDAVKHTHNLTSNVTAEVNPLHKRVYFVVYMGSTE